MSVQDTAQQLIDAAQAESDPFMRALLMATAGDYIAQSSLKDAAREHANGSAT